MSDNQKNSGAQSRPSLGYDAAPLTSFNAIKLSAREVAGTFIAPPAFDLLTLSDNAILSGPRGSGKTTLLKMLQSEGLEAWDDEKAEKTRSDVRTVGVFVGTDRSWNEQLLMPGFTGDLDARSRIAWAAFGSHTFRSLVDAMAYRTGTTASTRPDRRHLRVELTEATEREVAGQLSRMLGFETWPSSFSVLSQMLSERLLELGTLRQRLRRVGTVDLPDWADLDVIPLVDAAAKAFNTAVGQPEQRWALLFDELELAPEDLVHELLGALRGHQPRLVFKLSLAPANNILTALDGPNAPVQGQDYEHIPLTHARKTATLRFARELVSETMRLQGLTPAPPVNLLLGEGSLDSADEFTEDASSDPLVTRSRRSNPYAVGSPLWLQMESLANKDASFRAYLVKNQMDLQALERLSPSRRASRLRKIRNIVVVRDYFRNDHGRRRSRKSFALYSGADNILSLPDGNPRVLIALARQLFVNVQGAGLAARVPASHQGAAIEATLQRFLPLLEAQEAVRVGAKMVSLVEFLDFVGAALAKRVVELDFNDNVRLTFHVDLTALAPGVEDLVRRGVNTGALVYVPDKGSDGRLHGEFEGKKFRLSHLLATRYGLPIHLTPSVGLSKLLPPSLVRGTRRARRSSKDQDDGQQALIPRSEPPQEPGIEV